MIDIGVNFSSKQFNNYHDTYIEHCEISGISKIITISNSQKEWDSNMKLVEKYKNNKVKVYTTIGCHPHNAKEAANDEYYKKMLKYFDMNNVVAIGEAGLDYNRLFSSKEKQIEVFKKQIEIAHILNKPLFLHERDADEDMIKILSETKKKYPDIRGVIHCFTGKKSTMLKYLELGFYIGITGWICDNRRNADLVEAIKYLPIEKMMIETDAPWLIMYEYTKRFNTKRNESDALEYIVDSISTHTGYSVDNIIKFSTQNAIDFFNL